jgi:hypothetical protein
VTIFIREEGKGQKATVREGRVRSLLVAERRGGVWLISGRAWGLYVGCSYLLLPGWKGKGLRWYNVHSGMCLDFDTQSPISGARNYCREVEVEMCRERGG